MKEQREALIKHSQDRNEPQCTSAAEAEILAGMD